MRLFPKMKKEQFTRGNRLARANLNEWAIRTDPLFNRDTRKNSDNADSIIVALQDWLDATIIYGGWFEDRSYFLHDIPELKRDGRFLHLGDDVCVPGGTEISVAKTMRVLRVDCDTPEKHGWGTSIAMSILHTPFVMLYGHLGPVVDCRAGETVSPGRIIGTIGERADNGGWFPHVHAQLMLKEIFDTFCVSDRAWRELDGYGKQEDFKRLAKEYPDPLPFLGLFD